MKKVNFKKLSIVNFLSVGEEPVTIEFSKGLHVITGKNKDMFLESLSWSPSKTRDMLSKRFSLLFTIYIKKK